MSKASNQINGIIKRLDKTLRDATNAKSLKAVGKFTVDVVVKRTRLGYGVSKNYGERFKLAPLSDRYVKMRKGFEDLDSTTRPKKSNLTRTGQMLRSMLYIVEDGKAVIRPSERKRAGSKHTNFEIAQFNADGGKGRPKRIFNRVSGNEFKQIVRFYRKTFGDLLRLRNLID